MSTLSPVAELNTTTAASWWPVTTDGRIRMVALNDRLSLGEIGALMQQIAIGCLSEAADGCGEEVSANEAVRCIIDAEVRTICGGLRGEDGAGISVEPGCCADLDEWRGWTRFAERPTLWLGHDPSPWVEYRGSCLRLHPDGGMGACPRPEESGFVEFSFDELPDALRSVQRDLLGFLDAVEIWARSVVPDHAAGLVAALDAQLQVSQLLW